MRAGPGGALHRHVPDEQPGGGQRHAARRPLRQRRPHGRPRRVRAGAVRLHRPGRRPAPRQRARTTRGCRRTRACCPGSTRCSTSPRITARGWQWLGELGYTIRRPPTRTASRWRCWRPSASGRPSTACRRSSPTAARVDRPPGRAVVRPRLATCARTRRTPPPGAFATMYDPADCPVPAPIPAPAPPAARHGARRPRGRRPDRPGGDGPPAGAVLRDDQRGRRAARPRVGAPARAGHVGRHVHRRDRRPRRAARRPRAHAEGRLLRGRATTSSASSAIHAGPAATARSSSASPRTSTCCRRCARRWASRSRRSATASRSRRSCDGDEPAGWRDAAHWEYDWRDVFIGRGDAPVAVGPSPRAPAPRRAARRTPRLRAVRRRLVAVLRPRRRPDVADRGRRPGGRARRWPRRC